MAVGDAGWLAAEKKRLEELNREHARTQGEIKAVRRQLKELYGADADADLDALVKREEKKADELERDYQKKLKDYLKLHGKQLGVGDEG